jgi:hypothetical protein
MYGLIRQWSGSESEREVGEARYDRSGSGGGQMLAGVGRGGVADGVGAGGAGGFDAGDGSGDEGAFGRRGADRANGVLDQVRACLEVAGRVVPGSDDVVYLAGEVVRTEVRTDGPG